MFEKIFDNQEIDIFYCDSKINCGAFEINATNSNLILPNLHNRRKWKNVNPWEIYIWFFWGHLLQLERLKSKTFILVDRCVECPVYMHTMVQQSETRWSKLKFFSAFILIEIITWGFSFSTFKNSFALNPQSK